MARGGGMVGSGLTGVLWACFAMLVLAGGWLFLRACGLDALGLDYCPVRIDRSALVRERATGEDLAGQVHMAQMAVAETPLCAPPAAAPAPAMPVPPKRAETEAIDKKVVERGGQNGKLQFTLQWNTLDDLDLNVSCPGGRIDSQPGHAGPGICGDGRKDVDANGDLVRNLSNTPIENVVWQTDIPPGTYRIEVIEFKAATNVGNTVPFTLHMRWNDQDRICQGTVTELPISATARDAEGVIAGTAKHLTWTLSNDLPNCDLETGTTHRGASKR